MNINLMLPNCYYAHLKHILFHRSKLKNKKIIFTALTLNAGFMKWLTVNNNSNRECFELWEDEKKLANISFNKQTRFVRIVSGLGKRMFSFEKKGLLNPRKIIRDEYGVNLGKVEQIKPGTGKGIVVLDGKKYSFIYDQDNTGELVLYDEFMKTNLLSCSFKTINTGLTKTKSLLDSKFASLLLMLCWYSFQPHNNAVTEIV